VDLKNAVAVCLIALFSATLVVLIARALDMQTAERLEPQLARIAEQLEAIRQQGGIATVTTAKPEGEAPDDGLVVYYFHGNTRCATCEAIEAQSHDALKTHFAGELQDGSVVWKVLNYENPSGADLANEFGIQVPVVVLARMKDGKMQAWKRLDKVWALVGDKPAFEEFVRHETAQMLPTMGNTTSGVPTDSVPEIPIPTGDATDIPIPTDPAEIPVPE
jgi:hypothetical protein